MARRARRRHARRDGPREPAAHPASEGVGRALRDSAAADGQPRVRAGSESEPPPGEDGVLMKVRPGYKQTEVGVIPEDWKTHTIGDSLRLINGRAFKPEDWKERGLPIVRIQNLNDTESSFNYCSGPVEDRHRIET